LRFGASRRHFISQKRGTFAKTPRILAFFLFWRRKFPESEPHSSSVAEMFCNKVASETPMLSGG
jgi:hypothetical protein